jgi:hypothetical protein
LLISKGEHSGLDELVRAARQKLKDHLIEYDDKLYITISLWKYHKANNTLAEAKAMTELAIKQTPIMVSDIINKGDISDLTIRQDNLKLSRLYKALLLDLLGEYKKYEKALNEQDLDRRYSGEFTLKWGAFLTFSLAPFLITLIIALALKNQLAGALSFWALQETQIEALAQTTNPLSLVFIMYLITASATGAYSVYISLIKKKLVKDLRVWEHYKEHQQKAIKWFAISLLGALALSVMGRFAGSAMQKFLTGKG